jgi:hypothetical protein
VAALAVPHREYVAGLGLPWLAVAFVVSCTTGDANQSIRIAREIEILLSAFANRINTLSNNRKRGVEGRKPGPSIRWCQASFGWGRLVPDHIYKLLHTAGGRAGTMPLQVSGKSERRDADSGPGEQKSLAGSRMLGESVSDDACYEPRFRPARVPRLATNFVSRRTSASRARIHSSLLECRPSFVARPHDGQTVVPVAGNASFGSMVTGDHVANAMPRLRPAFLRPSCERFWSQAENCLRVAAFTIRDRRVSPRVFVPAGHEQ